MAFLTRVLHAPVRTIERPDSVTISTRALMTMFSFAVWMVPLVFSLAWFMTRPTLTGWTVRVLALVLGVWLSRRISEVSIRVEAERLVVSSPSDWWKKKTVLSRKNLQLFFHDDFWGFDGWDSFVEFASDDSIGDFVDVYLGYIETGTRFYEELKRALRRTWPTETPVKKPTSF